MLVISVIIVVITRYSRKHQAIEGIMTYLYCRIYLSATNIVELRCHFTTDRSQKAFTNWKACTEIFKTTEAVILLVLFFSNAINNM